MSASPTSLSSQVQKMSPNDSQDSSTAPSELVATVDDLLTGLTTKFDGVSGEILRKMDEMAKRLDNLETHIKASNAASLVEGEASEA